MNSVERAIEILRTGGVVAVPTETVYGLAGSISSSAAIENIFHLKERPFFDPLIVHVANKSQVLEVAAHIPAPLEKLMDRFWPGPLTVVLPKRQDLNPMITASHDTVAVRWPAHPLAQQLLLAVGPLAAPSANRFGRTSPTTADHVRSEFGDRVHIVDGGECSVGIESTVVSYNDRHGRYEIYRPGAVTLEDIGQFGPAVQRTSPVAPGQLDNHYQPPLPVVWMKSERRLDETRYREIAIALSLDELHPSWIELPSQPEIAARMVYAKLRSASMKPHANAILLVRHSHQGDAGLWEAIDDRIHKASRLVV